MPEIAEVVRCACASVPKRSRRRLHSLGMLPKSRIAASLVLGLAAALIAAGLFLPRALHTDSRIALDTGPVTWTLRDDTAQSRLLSSPEGRVLDAPVTKQVHFEFVDPADAETVTVKAGSTLMRESRQADQDRLITADITSYRMNRLTGLASSPATVADQMASPTRSFDIGGQWLKFEPTPANHGLEFYDSTLRRSFPLEFVEKSEIAGREVKVYHQYIEPQNVAQSYPGIFNTARLQDGSAGYLYHEVDRRIFVDVDSGLVLNIEENINDFYADTKREKPELVLVGEFRMSEENQQALAAAAEHTRGGQGIRIAGWVLLGCGEALALLALIGVFIGGRRARRERAGREEVSTGA